MLGVSFTSFWRVFQYDTCVDYEFLKLKVNMEDNGVNTIKMLFAIDRNGAIAVQKRKC